MTISIESNSGARLARGAEPSGVFRFEGNWYFEASGVELQHLQVTERIYTCPYKGVCYWIDLVENGQTSQNVGWVYRQPKAGYEQIKDCIAFYAGKRPATREVAGA
jgi:uncharacterized protein (DUF427 family)